MELFWTHKDIYLNGMNSLEKESENKSEFLKNKREREFF